jgi:hypothetical protein
MQAFSERRKFMQLHGIYRNVYAQFLHAPDLKKGKFPLPGYLEEIEETILYKIDYLH